MGKKTESHYYTLVLDPDTSTLSFINKLQIYSLYFFFKTEVRIAYLRRNRIASCKHASIPRKVSGIGYNINPFLCQWPGCYVVRSDTLQLHVRYHTN